MSYMTSEQIEFGLALLASIATSLKDIATNSIASTAADSTSKRKERYGISAAEYMAVRRLQDE